MGTKFQVGDRVRVNKELFPTFDQGLFTTLPKTGVVARTEPESILPYQVKIDTFEHHPFWFYENQLHFEDETKEKAWAVAHAPKPRVAGAKPAAAGGHDH